MSKYVIYALEICPYNLQYMKENIGGCPLFTHDINEAEIFENLEDAWNVRSGFSEPIYGTLGIAPVTIFI